MGRDAPRVSTSTQKTKIYLPPKYDEVFPDAFNKKDDNTPSAPPVQFDLVPIRTGTQRQNSVTNNRQTMI